jgi:hypothetical protein
MSVIPFPGRISTAPPPLADRLLHSWAAMKARAARCPPPDREPFDIDLNQLSPIPPAAAPGHYTSVRGTGTLGSCTCAACQPPQE